MNRRTAYLTIDVDFTDYISGSGIDEMREFFPVFRDLFSEFPSVKSTWFVRIDGQIEALYGCADYILKEYSKEFEWLRNSGHEIGWHHHSYVKRGNEWQQNVSENEVVAEVKKYGQIARNYRMNLSRMGWGQMSNRVMAELDRLGFIIDSSAMPRPKYSWDKLHRDWSRCPAEPYHPDSLDYQKKGMMKIVEFPMTTVPIELSSDTETGVMRYINPMYHNVYFARSLTSSIRDNVVLIVHPYELCQQEKSHPLLSFNVSVFKKNIKWLMNNGYCFNTLADYTSGNQS